MRCTINGHHQHAPLWAPVSPGAFWAALAPCVPSDQFEMRPLYQGQAGWPCGILRLMESIKGHPGPQKGILDLGPQLKQMPKRATFLEPELRKSVRDNIVGTQPARILERTTFPEPKLNNSLSGQHSRSPNSKNPQAKTTFIEPNSKKP